MYCLAPTKAKARLSAADVLSKGFVFRLVIFSKSPLMLSTVPPLA